MWGIRFSSPVFLQGIRAYSEARYATRGSYELWIKKPGHRAGFQVPLKRYLQLAVQLRDDLEQITNQTVV
ncbi:MAG: hypothetical protein V7772_08810, partial [Pseudomonas profundi]|uniref:hypothetical protein n=1 Tax=Pseudomonas profundi TaxID=1981513 RepID=UPI0030025E93